MNNQAKFAKTMEYMVAGVMLFAGIVDLIGAFRGISDLKYYGDGSLYSHVLVALISDFIFAALFMLVGITVIINRAKGIEQTKNSSYQFASIFGSYMIVAAAIFIHLYNEFSVEVPAKIIALLIFGIISLGGGMATKTLARQGKCAPALITGGISGVLCIVCNCIMMDLSNVGNTNTTYVAFIFASIVYLIYVFADNFVIQRNSTNNDTNHTGPVDATKFMNSKEKLPAQGKAYTPEEYYKHIGVKSKQDKSDDNEEK